MPVQTVEERIVEEFQCSVLEVFQQYVDEKKTAKEVATILNCNVSNIRRIARKHGVFFNQSLPEVRGNKTKDFLSMSINSANFLSRAWAS